MIYKSVYQSQTEDGESMTADTLHEDDPTTNTGVCKRVKEDSMAEEPGTGFIEWPTDAEVRAHFDDYVTAVGRIAYAWKNLHERLGAIFVQMVNARISMRSLRFGIRRIAIAHNERCSAQRSWLSPRIVGALCLPRTIEPGSPYGQAALRTRGQRPGGLVTLRGAASAGSTRRRGRPPALRYLHRCAAGSGSGAGVRCRAARSGS